MNAKMTTTLGKHVWNHDGDGFLFRRFFNESWGVDQLSVTMTHPPCKNQGPGEDPTYEEIGVGGLRIPFGDVFVVWEEGFSITTDRPDQLEKVETNRFVLTESISLAEATRRIEKRTEGPRLIRQKQAAIKKLEAEILALQQKGT
jgi:hypothetical protein